MTIAEVSLCKITRDNVLGVLALTVKPEQAHFVANNTKSLAQAYVYQNRAWPRAIYAGDEPVGFLMLDLVMPDHPDAEDGQASYFLWRLMIAAEHQWHGYGHAALTAAVEHVRSLPDAEKLKTSYVPGPGCPGPFYERFGFEPTGVVEEGEIILRLNL